VQVPPLAFVALVPLFWAAFPATGAAPGFGRRFLLGYLCGVVFFVSHLYWLLLLSKEELTIPWIMIPALLALSAFLALYFGFGVALTGVLARRSGLSPAWVLPVVWTLLDRVRAAGEIGFPWGSLAYALAPWPAALQMSAFTGYWGLLFWVVLVNGLIWLCGQRWRFEQSAEGGTWSGGGLGSARRVALVAGLLLAVPIAAGYAIVARAPRAVEVLAPRTAADAGAQVEGDLARDGGGSRGAVSLDEGSGATAGSPGGVHRRSPIQGGSGAVPLRFALIQANTPREIKWQRDYREIVVKDLLARTDRAVDLYHPDLVVWPETAAPMRILWEPKLEAMVHEQVAALHTPVLVGTLDARTFEDRPWEHYNAAILYDATGTPVHRYYKRHMVPFGENTPYKNLFPVLGKIDFGQSDFTSGKDEGLFRLPGHRRFGCLICFESAFPELARDDVRDGAEFLVNITNDFWFGKSAGPLQHAHFAIHRAVENRTPLVRCANSGYSFFVDPYGRVQARTDLFVAALPAADVAPGRGGSFYTRHGDWPLGVLAGAAVLLVVLAVFRRRHPPAPPRG
jgi:apolipoprotein N-acyltransferase